MNHIGFYLRKIYFHKLTGQLIFKRGSVEKYLFFQDGELVHAKTSVPEERLGEILYKLGKISDEAHSEIERYIEPEKQLGETLTQKGQTSPRNVEDGLTYQMREITLSLFPYFDAEISFQERPSLGEQGFATRINVPYLIEDGIRRMKFQPELQKFLEKKTPIPQVRVLYDLLTEEEKEILNNVKGTGTSEALWRSNKYNPEFFWKSLYLFYCLNLIDFRDKDAIPEKEIKEGAPVRPDVQEQLQEFLDFKEKMSALNYYQILGVAKNASEEDIKKAYFQLARKFHPDRFDRTVPSEYRVQIEDVFDKITKAYRTLTSKQERQHYDIKGAPGPPGREERGIDVAKKADIKFRQAKTLFTLGRYEDAVILLEEAVRMNRYKGDYFLLLAMTEAKISAFRKKAEEHFIKAAELEPWNPEAYVGLGVLYKEEGLLTKALKQFHRALEIDTDHEMARREVEAMGKGEKKGGLKGLFSMNIFGSKKK
jgi:tetratricopeptide (TPR) repeat protein